MLVPSPAFRSMALGIMVAVVFVLAATLTLLPAVLGALGPKVDRLALRWVHSGEHRSPFFARWAERIWARPLLYGVPALLVLLVLAAPVLGLRTGMPSIKVVPPGDTSRVGYTQVQAAFGAGAPGALQLVARPRDAAALTAIARADPGIAAVTPPQRSADGALRARAGHPAPEPVRPGRRRYRSTGSAGAFRRARWSAAQRPRTTTSRPRSRTRRRS